MKETESPVPMEAASPVPRARQGGFATVTVMILLLISAVGGAYLLKLTRSQASASGGYYQARAAAMAAQAGLEAGLASLESDPVGSLALLNGYLADSTRNWLLGDSADADSRHLVKMDNGLQRYAARIVVFDPLTGMIKVEGQGEGPGGSESKVYGVYRLGGLALPSQALAKYVWFMAGEARNVDQRVDVTGDVYFGGGVHFNGGADNSVMNGRVKIARGAGLESSFDAGISFLNDLYVQTPIKSQGLGAKFARNAGFEDGIFIDTDPQWTRAGQTAWFNGNVTGGHASVDMNGSRVVHSGSLDLGRVTGASSVTNNGGGIDIAGALGMLPGPESEITVNMDAVPAAKRFTPAELGIGAYGNVRGAEFSAAYAAAAASGRLYRGFLFIDVDSPMNFQDAPGDVLSGKFVFRVTSQVNVNLLLPASDPASVCLWYVRSGASLMGFGGSGLFRGYVHVKGTGSVIYQWGPGCEFQGAIHHVSPLSGFQLNGSTGPLKLVFDQGVFDELAPLEILLPPGTSPPAAGTPPVAGAPPAAGTPPKAGAPVPGAPVPTVRLVDRKIRPYMHSRYF